MPPRRRLPRVAYSVDLKSEEDLAGVERTKDALLVQVGEDSVRISRRKRKHPEPLLWRNAASRSRAQHRGAEGENFAANSRPCSQTGLVAVVALVATKGHEQKQDDADVRMRLGSERKLAAPRTTTPVVLF